LVNLQGLTDGAGYKQPCSNVLVELKII